MFAEDHVTALFVALDGNTATVNDFVEPTFRANDVGETVTDATDMVIVTVHVAVRFPLTVVALITALPAETAVITPDEFTVAFAEVELHTTVLSVALDGVIVAVSDNVLVG